MNRFKELSIKGFRRLYDIKLKLPPLSVLIGANGAGKTSLLDVFSILSASAAGNLNAKLGEFGGIKFLATNNRANDISFSLSMEIPNHNPLDYYLTIGLSGFAYQIERETLCQEKGREKPFKHIDSYLADIKYYDVQKEHKFVKPNWEYNPMETSLSQVPKMYPEPEDFRKLLASTTYYHILNVGLRAPVRQPQQMKPATLPGKDGEDLITCLYSLRETNRDRFEAIEDSLKSAFPGFERLDFPPVAAGTLSMTWKDKNFSDPIYTHQLSEGTLRFLWLTALLQSPGLTAITLLDEPEVSLHPELLSILADLMREASQRSQIIVATHSDMLIRFLKPAEVFVMDINEEGFADITWAEQMDLNKWLEDYTLDQIWRMARMGGRA